MGQCRSKGSLGRGDWSFLRSVGAVGRVAVGVIVDKSLLVEVEEIETRHIGCSVEEELLGWR